MDIGERAAGGPPSRGFAPLKLRRFTPVLAFCLCALAPAAPRAGAAADPLRGSVVKSEKWTMDRVKNREIFDGDVSFRNADYNLKADHAVYDRKPRLWTLRGSVYCLRKFPDGSNIELYCDNGTYDENREYAELFRGRDLIRMKHLAADGKALNGRCDRINADNAKGSMDFLGDFYMRTETMELFSANAFYSDRERSFLIYGSTPVAAGNRDGHDFAMTGEKIKYFKDTGDVKLQDHVAGWVKAVETPARR
jgi:lipopolysaccharide export system protein LptA